MKLYAIVIEDRHSDVEVELWPDRDKAIARARELALKCCRFPDDYHESTNAAWVFYAVYSCEDDSVTVLEREVHP